jgi:UDPglucose 6-dehydrogenase
MRVMVAGSGYVGLVAGACLADAGNDVIGYDIDTGKVEALNNGEIPIFEPGLAELVKHNHDLGRLTFTTDLDKAMDHARVVFISIGTAPKADGSADLSGIEAFARSMAPLVSRELVVTIKSTVPVGTGEHVEKIIREVAKHPVHLISNPEFLKEGAAVQDFQRPERVVIGYENEEAAEIIRELYVPFVRNQRPILMMRRRAAELAKYACNGILASRISFINEIANLCDACDVDVDEVRKAMGTDSRIGFQFLYPGAGYGGSCFPKDVRALIHTAKSVGMTPSMLSASHETNESQKRILFSKIEKRFGGDLSGKTFAIWGIAFKPNTDDIREAPALTLIRQLLEAGASIRAHDPEALVHLREEFGNKVSYFDDNYEALRGASAMVVCTEWSNFRSPDFDRIKELLAEPIVFDGRNLYELSTMTRNGMEYHPIGRPAVVPGAANSGR